MVPAPAKLQAPQAKPDEATVRTNDVVSIPVLANDTDPNGRKLTLVHDLAQQPDSADGRMFVSGDYLRFVRRRAKNRLCHLQSPEWSGQVDSQQVTIRIQARDDERNSRPEPRNLTARVVAGMVVKIPVPLDGIDTNGDSVQLLGIDKAPGMGTAVVRDGYLEFTAAGDGAGTDTFTYRVRDRIGAENTGTVIVGIAPPEPNNQKPIAVDDAVDIRPGRKVAVEALANDSDPDGDPLSLVANGFEAKPELKVEAADGAKVLFTAPGTAGNESITYRIQDDKKASAGAVIRIRSARCRAAATCGQRRPCDGIRDPGQNSRGRSGPEKRLRRRRCGRRAEAQPPGRQPECPRRRLRERGGHADPRGPADSLHSHRH